MEHLSTRKYNAFVACLWIAHILPNVFLEVRVLVVVYADELVARQVSQELDQRRLTC